MQVSRTSLLLVLVLLCGGAACTRNANVESAAPGARPAAAKPEKPLNVGALVGRSIDQVRRELGTPQEKSGQAVGPEPSQAQLRATKGEGWINTFEVQGSTLVVTFNARTREVQDIVLLGSNEDELLRRGGLSFVSEKYLVLPVVNPTEPSKIMGVRVVERN